MSKYGSYIYQLTNMLKELDRIGESRHQAKTVEQTNSPEGIFSIGTMQTYRTSAIHFLNWVKDASGEKIKDIKKIPEEVAVEYLRWRIQECSDNTVATDISAINKIFDMNISFAIVGVARSYKKITRSRLPRKMDCEYSFWKQQHQITIAKAFGLRRQSICGGNYQVKHDSFFFIDTTLYVSVIEKGGKFRNVRCLKEYQDDV